MTAMPTIAPERPQRVQAAFDVWAGAPDCGPNARAMFQYIETLEAELARHRSDRQWIIGFNDGWEAALNDA